MQTENRPSIGLAQQTSRKASIYQRFFKRPMDIALSLCAIVILSPAMLLIAFLVRINLGSPVIFRQSRPGLKERIFTLYKFRTMTDERDSNGKLLPDDRRLTRFGRWLRSTSLDELPELYNVLRGDMSLIGPRPLLVGYLTLYNQHQRRRHEVRPGMTGLAQVSGRNAVSWEKRFGIDVQYADNVSFLGDCRIALLTLRTVVVREGVNSQSAATMEMYTGSTREGPSA